MTDDLAKVTEILRRQGISIAPYVDRILKLEQQLQSANLSIDALQGNAIEAHELNSSRKPR